MMDIEEMNRKRLEGQAAKVAARLRDMADMIDREGARYIDHAAEGRHEWSTYTRAAAQIEHEVAWGVANLNLSGLIETAGDADRARATKSVDPRAGLDAMIDVAKGWAETCHQNQDGSRDQVPVSEQTFVLDDILRMVIDAANQAGLRPAGEEKS